jgi:hypothetical protein
LSLACRLLSRGPMIGFALGLWLGAALGACVIGALCAQDREPLVLGPALHEAAPSRVAALRRAASRLH